jgi:hypothetical protein
MKKNAIINAETVRLANYTQSNRVRISFAKDNPRVIEKAKLDPVSDTDYDDELSF